MSNNIVVIKPKITEKSLSEAKSGMYTFEVDTDASKTQIKESVEKMFNVTISTVQTVVRKGKVRRVGKRQSPKKESNKKVAYVHVIKGKIDLFPQA